MGRNFFFCSNAFFSVSVQSWTTRRPGWQRSMAWCIDYRRKTGRCLSCWWSTWASRWRTSTRSHSQLQPSAIACVIMCQVFDSSSAESNSDLSRCFPVHAATILPGLIVVAVHPQGGLELHSISWPFELQQRCAENRNPPSSHPVKSISSTYPLKGKKG